MGGKASEEVGAEGGNLGEINAFSAAVKVLNNL